jgi:hypothetical protein
MTLGSVSNPAGSVVLDANQFSYPTYGGATAVMIGSFDFEDTTAKTLFTLPAGAVPLDWWFDVTTDFNAGTNNNLDLGAAADTDYFADDIAIGTQGLFRAGVSGSVAGRLGVRFLEDTAITALYAPTGTTVTQGEANFFMLYMLGNSDFVID